MHTTLVRVLLAPTHYWRTLALMAMVGFAIDAISQNVVAVGLSTMACAFVFRSYETRRWLSMATELHAGDIFVRALMAFVTTSVVCGTQTPAL
jgi:hypothetical protein